MSELSIMEGAWEELRHPLERFSYALFCLVPLSKPQEKAKEPEGKEPRPSALGKYAFVAGGSEEFAKEKQEEIEREDPLIALLEQWIAEAPTDPEEIKRANEELEEFKRNLNRNRLMTGERPLFLPVNTEDAVDAKLREWQEQDGSPLMPDVPAQVLFAQWAEEDAKMTEEEREAERVLWGSIEQGLAEQDGRLQLRYLGE